MPWKPRMCSLTAQAWLNVRLQTGHTRGLVPSHLAMCRSNTVSIKYCMLHFGHVYFCLPGGRESEEGWWVGLSGVGYNRWKDAMWLYRFLCGGAPTEARCINPLAAEMKKKFLEGYTNMDTIINNSMKNLLLTWSSKIRLNTEMLGSQEQQVQFVFNKRKQKHGSNCHTPETQENSNKGMDLIKPKAINKRNQSWN